MLLRLLRLIRKATSLQYIKGGSEGLIRSFGLYADASGISGAIQKRQLLLHCAEPQTQDIYFNFEPEPEPQIMKTRRKN